LQSLGQALPKTCRHQLAAVAFLFVGCRSAFENDVAKLTALLQEIPQEQRSLLDSHGNNVSTTAAAAAGSEEGQNQLSNMLLQYSASCLSAAVLQQRQQQGVLHVSCWHGPHANQQRTWYAHRAVFLSATAFKSEAHGMTNICNAL
jgi:hypothetical protein